jgi:thiol-disulfide isomerase/thioredoxin
MMMRLKKWAVAFAFLAAPLAATAEETLKIGDKAPPLEVSKWLKGEKIDGFEKGRVYVVEFWSTWCGACVANIPHLTKLQKKFKDVAFIGVDIWEQHISKVEPLVKEMGDKMDYRVALDVRMSEDEMGTNGKMAVAWMTASESTGVPTAFIVDKESKIAWIGHPNGMEKPLEKIVAGDWDLKVVAEEREKKMVVWRARKKFKGRLSLLMKDEEKNAKEILSLCDEEFTKTPALAKYFGTVKFTILTKIGDPRASTYGAELVDSVYKDDGNALRTIAWTIVDPDFKGDKSKRDVKLALRAAERANELTNSENISIVQAYALTAFENGDKAKAVELQEKAVKLAPKNAIGLQAMKDQLEKYRKTAETK